MTRRCNTLPWVQTICSRFASSPAKPVNQNADAFGVPTLRRVVVFRLNQLI